ncbi:MAG: methyltransferase domain-containing protein [Gemmataceae bacterium]
MSRSDLPPSLLRLVQRLSELHKASSKEVKEIVTECNVQQEDLLAWSNFDHSSEDSYGRQMAYDGGHFEIMVMSWLPGDYSAIHDHGYTEWGAVQVFGPAEHAVFVLTSDTIMTLSRTRLTPGRVLAVGNELIHQMGNPTNQRFLSLHVYGATSRPNAVTADSRVIDVTSREVQWTDGGVFYSLPRELVKKRAPGPESDYYTWVFEIVQKLLRNERAGLDTNELIEQMTNPGQWDRLKEELLSRLDDRRHVNDSRYWGMLYDVFRVAARLQDKLIDGYDPNERKGDDHWRNYASFYDRVIGTTNSYLPKYLAKVFERYDINPKTISFVDVGCGTGWLEGELQSQFGMRRDQILAVDPSRAMLDVAKTRSAVRQAGLLDLCPEDFGRYSVTFCNSYQYLSHEDFEEAVQRIASITESDGLCIGEFITQDHIRWYPNLVIAEDDTVMSLRNPTLKERDGYTYKESEIINVSRAKRMRITHEGTHRRFMVSPRRVHEVFEKSFARKLEMFDAISFAPIPLTNETCPSTRYLICAQNSKHS